MIEYRLAFRLNSAWIAVYSRQDHKKRMTPAAISTLPQPNLTRTGGPKRSLPEAGRWPRERVEDFGGPREMDAAIKRNGHQPSKSWTKANQELGLKGH